MASRAGANPLLGVSCGEARENELRGAGAHQGPV
jgi:hypothetical protein